MKLQILSIAAAVALAFGTAQAQTSSKREMKSAEKERIEADYKADKAKCDSMQGNAKDVCMKEAKGKENVAKAELNAKNNPSASNQRKVDQAKAKADYEVAKEKCDDQKGKEKSACEKEAKAAYDRAKADIKKADAKSAGTGATAATSKRTSTVK
jgi:Flp pilus assembly protein TadB